MKQIKRLIFIFAITFIVGCAKDETFTEQSLSKIDSSTKVDFMLGRKIENAYSLEYMRKSYEVLKERCEISESINIETTHLYIKLSPQDTAEMNCILADTVLELFPYPLDYELIGEGEYVVEENTTPDLYTVIPVDHNLDGRINFEILEECFIPEDYDENPDLAKLELKALYLSGNISEEQIGQEINARASWWRRPAGSVKVCNTGDGNSNNYNYEPVRGVKVRVHNIVKISSMYTNSNGYYSSGKSFLTDVHYSAVFENSKGFKVWSNLGPFSPAIHNVGWHSKNGYDITIGANSCAWPWATINNATLDYYNVICPHFNIPQPYNKLRIWYLSGVVGSIINSMGDWEGSTPMMRNITLSVASLAEYLFILGLLESPALSITTAAVYGVMLCFPDVFITDKNRTTNSLRRLIFHELSHASHYTQVGPEYWAQYIYQICYNVITSSGNNAYGSEQNEHNNIVGVGEMWAYYFEYKCIGYCGYSVPYFPGGNEWFAPKILKQIEENGDAITPRKIYDALRYHVQSHGALKQELISRYGQEQIINQAFEEEGF